MPQNLKDSLVCCKPTTVNKKNVGIKNGNGNSINVSNDATNDAEPEGHNQRQHNGKSLQSYKRWTCTLLDNVVECLVGGTIDEFVPETMGKGITADLINGLHRGKVHFKLLQEEKDEENQSNGNAGNNAQEEEQAQRPHNPGLRPNLEPAKIGLSAPRADDETERHLRQEELIKQAPDKIETKGRKNKHNQI